MQAFVLLQHFAPCISTIPSSCRITAPDHPWGAVGTPWASPQHHIPTSSGAEGISQAVPAPHRPPCPVPMAAPGPQQHRAADFSPSP